MSERHRMTLEADDGDGVLFSCDEGCGRRLVVKRTGGLVVLDRGNFFAMHSGGSEGLGISTTILD